ncbi:hypothetical protein LTR53_000675 [Teratosphaeriaceae sp. CCFEE 6253]|nr:hypothetical protein LTR53_000675 [Teratosphaeriaceae sp. CCFEE 6253]
MAAYDRSHFVEPDSSFDPSTLSGKSVVITGGASGLGLQLAKDFVAAGAFVTIGDVNAEGGKQVVSDLGGETKAAFVKCDVLSWQDQVQLFKTAIECSPSKGVDVVLANAGISGQDDIIADKTDEKTGDPLEPDLSIFKIDAIGPLYTAKLALHYLARQPEGEGRDRCLIMTASLAGYLGLPGAPQYNGAKFAVRGYMNSLRLTAPGKGVRVNVLAPWFIKTAIMSQPVINKLEELKVDFAQIEDASSAVLHLASDTSLNGRALAVVARKVDPRGYMDLREDDFREGEFLLSASAEVKHTTHRIATSLEAARNGG